MFVKEKIILKYFQKDCENKFKIMILGNPQVFPGGIWVDNIYIVYKDAHSLDVVSSFMPTIGSLKVINE